MGTQKHVLVTGAAGFIGSHVVDHCLGAGMRVTATDSFYGGFKENINPKVGRFVEGDLTDPAFVVGLFLQDKFDYVYHCAAYAAEGLSHHVRRFNYNTNLIASINLINESVLRGVKHFVFTSSIAVYGSAQTPMKESTIPEPEDPYGISKYAVELDLKAAHKMFGLNYTIFRPHNVYGERQNIADPYRNVIGIFMRQTLQGQPLTVFGDGKQTRAFTHIDDVAPYIVQAPELHDAKNEVFNIGSNQKYTVLDILSFLSDIVKVPLEVKHLPARNEVVHAFSDHKKMEAVFEPGDYVPLYEGLCRMWGWVKGVGLKRPTSIPVKTEVAINMPKSWASLEF